jgi:hypothetical protein
MHGEVGTLRTDDVMGLFCHIIPDMTSLSHAQISDPLMSVLSLL